MNRYFLLHIIIAFFLFVPEVWSKEKNFTVVIDAGHGGKDPGACGVTAKEKDINLSVALKFGRQISEKHKDVKVIYTRETDKFIELDERANIANRHKADIFISIHTNAAAKKNSSAKGTETFTLGLARTDENLQVAMRENSAILLEDNYLQKYEGFDPNSTESYIIFEFMQNKHMEQSVGFASEIQKSFVSVKRDDRGVRQAGLLVLRKTSMPSVLVELGFISNREEERYMMSNDGQTKLANALYEAFCKYKREYDRKQGALSAGNTTVVSNNQQNNIPESLQNTNGEIVYKVQILASGQKQSANSKQFKGYKNVDHFVENGVYKYTYGQSTDLNDIQKLRKSVSLDFKDAFIVAFKDGERVNLNDLKK